MPRPTPPYRIETERTVIRCWDPADAPLLRQALDESLEHLRAWMAWAIDEPSSLDESVTRLRRFRAHFDLDQDYTYAIFDSVEQAVLGSTGLHTRRGEGAFEIGYWIHVDHINQGLATEVTAALTKVAFALCHVDRVEIHCDPRNVRSAAVPRKLGFTHEATLRRRAVTPTGEPRDSMVWTLFAADYPRTPAADAKIAVYDILGNSLMDNLEIERNKE